MPSGEKATYSTGGAQRNGRGVAEPLYLELTERRLCYNQDSEGFRRGASRTPRVGNGINIYHRACKDKPACLAPVGAADTLSDVYAVDGALMGGFSGNA